MKNQEALGNREFGQSLFDDFSLNDNTTLRESDINKGSIVDELPNNSLVKNGEESPTPTRASSPVLNHYGFST